MLFRSNSRNLPQSATQPAPGRITETLSDLEKKQKMLDTITIIGQKQGRQELTQAINDIKRDMAQEYKIHLMPASTRQLQEILEILQKDYVNNERLQQSLQALKYFKQAALPTFNYSLENLLAHNNADTVLPILVLYPKTGKEHAQYVLDRVFELFKDSQSGNPNHPHGLGITPRYNIRVDDLIYYAQGNGDEKNRKEFAKYFKHPEKYFYADDFEEEPQDYALTIPS